MKTIILFGLQFFLLAQFAFSQEQKFKLSFEYASGFSKISDELIDAKFKFSHNALVRVDYVISDKINITSGLGFLNTGERIIIDLMAQQDVKEMDIKINYNYILIPIGARFKLGKYFVLPELAYGIIVHDVKKITTYLENGEVEKEKQGILQTTSDSELNNTLPIFLSIGREFKFSNDLKLLLGFKGYYSLIETVSKTPIRVNNYYGVGMFIGLTL